MTTNSKFRILNCIGEVYEEAKNSKFKDDFFSKADNNLIELANYFGTSKTQSFFIAMVFTMNYKGNSVDFNDLIDYFDCNPTNLLKFTDDFKFLEDKCIFIKSKSRHRANVSFANFQYSINEKISEAILNNQSMPKVEIEIKDILEVLEQIYNTTIKREQDDLNTLHLVVVTEQLLETYSEFQLIKTIKNYKLETEDILLYIYVIWKTISGVETCDLETVLEKIFSNATDRIRYLQSVTSKKNVLIRNKLLELMPAGFYSAADIKLTKVSSKILKECNLSVFGKNQDRENTILPSKIVSRDLIFNPSEMKQLYLVKDLLKPMQFKNTMRRLEEKHLPKGVTVLLHGAPGTGKTEVVKQMAKETNRELMKVDISQSKSMWFGESEKVVKKIFTDYKAFAEEAENTPILLFNEADAIISKRSSSSITNTSKTENAIQNIILEELENFEGILMATTNLPGNLDSAFERRFLFKIEFKKPNDQVRTKIWQSKLSFLSLDQCSLLANQFDFSGGQIDNIVRKTEIQEIIQAKDVNFETIKEFCTEETLTHKRIEIGFSKP